MAKPSAVSESIRSSGGKKRRKSSKKSSPKSRATALMSMKHPASSVVGASEFLVAFGAAQSYDAYRTAKGQLAQKFWGLKFDPRLTIGVPLGVLGWALPRFKIGGKMISSIAKHALPISLGVLASYGFDKLSTFVYTKSGGTGTGVGAFNTDFTDDDESGSYDDDESGKVNPEKKQQRILNRMAKDYAKLKSLNPDIGPMDVAVLLDPEHAAAGRRRYLGGGAQGPGRVTIMSGAYVPAYS